MARLALLSNVLFFGFTTFVLLTDGVSREPAYALFTVLLLLIPPVTVFAVTRGGVAAAWSPVRTTRPPASVPTSAGRPSFGGAAFSRAAAACNLVLAGFVFWAIFDQFPHPDESGLLAYTALAVFTPVLSAIVLLRSGTAGARQGP